MTLRKDRLDTCHISSLVVTALSDADLTTQEVLARTLRILSEYEQAPLSAGNRISFD